MWEKVWSWADVKRSRCEDEQMWEKMWRWADVKMSRCERRCERRCEDEQMWRWADVREDVREDMKMSRWEKMWEKMWRWADVKMSRCEDEQMWRWADVKMSRCERRCEDEQMWEQMWEKMWRWADVKMRRCERRCEDEKVWRWEDEIQTPTIGRTLRSDALGKNQNTCAIQSTVPSVPSSKQQRTLQPQTTQQVPEMKTPTLWWTNIAMENHHAIHGKIHYFNSHFPLLFVCSPEGIISIISIISMIPSSRPPRTRDSSSPSSASSSSTSLGGSWPLSCLTSGSKMKLPQWASVKEHCGEWNKSSWRWGRNIW